jgi:hypothetical protein
MYMGTIADWFCPGEWLCDGRLLNKILDVRVRGTKRTLWRNGKYEDQIGFTVLTRVLSNVDDKILVKLGYNETSLTFPLKYLHPEMTTERDRLVPASQARPVIYYGNYRVVVIGSDMSSNFDLVGNYGKVVGSESLGSTKVRIISPGPFANQEYYFREDALCASCERQVMWDDSLIA